MAENEKPEMTNETDTLEAAVERLKEKEKRTVELEREVAELKAENEKLRSGLKSTSGRVLEGGTGSAAPTVGKNNKLFIIDAVAMFRHNLRSLLLGSGFEVVGEAGFPDEATIIEDVLQKRPDMVTIDFRMPGLESEKVIGRIRSSLPNAKVVIVSAELSPDEIHSLIKAGAHGFITKPVHRDRLITVLEGLSST